MKHITKQALRNPDLSLWNIDILGIKLSCSITVNYTIFRPFSDGFTQQKMWISKMGTYPQKNT